MRMSSRAVAILCAALLAFAAAGCAKKPVATPPVPPAPTPAQTPAPTPTPPPPAPAPEPAKPAVAAGDLKIVYFGYDSFTLDDAARTTLDADAKLLRDNPTLS